MQVARLVLALPSKNFLYYEAHVLEGCFSTDSPWQYLCDYPRTLPLKGKPSISASAALRQRLQQRLGLLEISGVKALGEPPVDIPKHLPRFVSLPLTLPQSSQAGGSS